MTGAFLHSGITVRSLPSAIEFYEQAFGYAVSDRAVRPEPYTRDVTGVEGCSIKIAILTLGNHTLELLEFSTTRRRLSQEPRRLSPDDPGFAHLSYVVDDIDAKVRRLASLGASFERAVVVVPSHPNKGGKVVYGKDPDGNAFELVERAK